MAELIGRHAAGERLPDESEFIPGGVDHLMTTFGKVTVIRGEKKDGTKGAFLLGIDCPPEITFGDENPTRQGGFLTDLKDSSAVRVIGGVALAASGAAALAGCQTTTTDHAHYGNNHNNGSTTYSIETGALTTQDLGNIKGQPLPTSHQGDWSSNFAEMDGVKYLLIGNSGNAIGDITKLVYIQADTLEGLLSPSALRKAGEYPPPFSGKFYNPAIYQDPTTGKYKFMLTIDSAYRGDAGIDKTDGVLMASNFDPNFTTAGPSMFTGKDGYPHGFMAGNGITDHNFKDDSEIQTPLGNDFSDCGAPTMEGDLVIGSKSMYVQGVEWCQLVMANSLDELANNPILITSLNINQPSHRLTNPRLMDNVLIYSVGAETEEKLWYALITPTTINPDSPDVPDTLDAIDSTADAAADVLDTAVQPDAPDTFVTPDITQKDAGADVQLDSSDIQPPQDIPPAPDTNSDTNADTALDTAPTCTSEFPGFAITAGNCSIKACPITEGGKNGETIDITGDGANNVICKATGVSNDKPVQLTLSNDKGGSIKVTYKYFPATSLEMYPADDTTNELQEDGAGAQGKAYGVTMASSASHFNFTPRGIVNGAQIIDLMNAQGEVAVRVTSANFTEFVVWGDGKVYEIKAQTGDHAPKIPDLPDGGTTIDIQPQKVDAGSEAGNPANEVDNPGNELGNPSNDAGASGETGAEIIPPSPGNGKDGSGSCSAAPGVPENINGIPIAMALAALALLASRRRQVQEVQTRRSIEDYYSKHIPGPLLARYIGEKLKQVFSRKPVEK